MRIKRAVNANKNRKKVLKAAALTYVASALTAIANLLRLLFIARDRRN